MNEAIARAADLLRQAGKAVALTGAGTSVESGIPDFRSPAGLWSRFDPLEYGTLSAFRRQPAKVWHMLAELVDIVQAEPNAGHYSLAALEDSGLLAGIITQNIDGLHQKAGSRRVVEFHGSLNTFTCPACRRQFPLSFVLAGALPPACASCDALLKPDVVFFEEAIPAAAFAQTAALLAGADLLLVAGTSCRVAPASSLPHQVRAQGGKLIEINPEPALAGQADLVLPGRFARTMAELAAALGVRPARDAQE